MSDLPIFTREADERIAELEAELHGTVTTEYHDKIVAEAIQHIVNCKAEIEKIKAAYNQLIYAVEGKFEGETRHQTALRYIKQREEASRVSPAYGKSTKEVVMSEIAHYCDNNFYCKNREYIAELEAENARLREALRIISMITHYPRAKRHAEYHLQESSDEAR